MKTAKDVDNKKRVVKNNWDIWQGAWLERTNISYKDKWMAKYIQIYENLIIKKKKKCAEIGYYKDRAKWH